MPPATPTTIRLRSVLTWSPAWLLLALGVLGTGVVLLPLLAPYSPIYSSPVTSAAVRLDVMGGAVVLHLEVYHGVMSRTNIDIDEALVAEVMGRYRLESKRSAVDFALRNLIAEPMSQREILAMRGSGIEFENDQVEAGWTAE